MIACEYPWRYQSTEALVAYFRTIVETVLGSVNDFVWQTVLDSSTLLGAKYSLVGAAVAWANFGAGNTLNRYLKAGLIAGTGAALITMTVMNAVRYKSSLAQHRAVL